VNGDYTLAVRVDHMRRPSMSSLLYSLAYRALAEERAGAAWEQVHCHLTGDGDYAAVALIDDAAAIGNAGRAVSTTTNGTAVAEDDISAADRIRNQERRDADEAERLRRIEAAKQADRERFSRGKK